MSNCYECKKIYSNYTEEFINLAVISDYVYIGGKTNLIKLNSALGIVNSKPTRGTNWLLAPYEVKNEDIILISCDYKGEYESDCIGYRSNLSIVTDYDNEDIKIKKPHARYTTTTVGSSNFLTIASSDCLSYRSPGQCSAISIYQEQPKPFHAHGKYAVKYSDIKNFSFDFRTVVGNGRYTYFLFVFNNTVSKLGKLCTDANYFTNPLNAYEDVPIYCSHNGVNFTTAQDLMFWNDDLLVAFTDGTSSVICRITNLYDNFEISRIDRLKCPIGQLKNKYFYNPSLSVCYDETKNKCQSSKEVSIIVCIIVFLNEIAKGN
jgi:hypothetical protein